MKTGKTKRMSWFNGGMAYWACLLSFAMSLLGCAGAERQEATSATPRKGGTIVVGLEGDFGALDPHNPTGAGIASRIMAHAFEYLITEDFHFTDPQKRNLYLPVLAESWELSPDGMSITYKLRKNVKFHDGSPFNVDAVKFHFDRLTNAEFPYYHKVGAGRNLRSWQFVKDAQVVDPYTIRFNFKEFDPNFLTNQKYRYGGWMGNPEVLKRYSEDEVADHPVGTGPYRVTEVVRGEKVVLEKFKDYWGEEPLLDRIIWRPIPEHLGRVAALQAGEVDVIVEVFPDSVQPLREDGRFEVTLTNAMDRWLFHFNTRVSPYNDKRVRQAINHAVNRDGLVKDILKGTARPMVSVLVDTSPGFDPSVKRYAYDPAKAKALLAEAGLPNGFTTTWWIPTSGSGMMFPVPMTEYIAGNLKDVGIDVKLQTQEWTSYFGRFRTGLPPEFGAAAMSWAAEVGVPRDLEFLIPSLVPPKGLNVGWYDSRQVQELWDRGRATFDPVERERIYKQIVPVMMEDAPWLFGVYNSKPIAVHKKIKNFTSSPLAYHFPLTKVWVAE